MERDAVCARLYDYGADWYDGLVRLWLGTEWGACDGGITVRNETGGRNTIMVRNKGEAQLYDFYERLCQ